MIIIGGDPGATAGVVGVEFTPHSGNPLWRNARLRFAEVIHKPERASITKAENDIEYARKITAVLIEHSAVKLADFVALEEPLDGGKIYAATNTQGQKGLQQRDTAFRLGVHYAALLHGVSAATYAPGYNAPRIISFPAKAQRRAGRRGWMPPGGKRENALMAGRAILTSISTVNQIAALPRDRSGNVVEHILMAVGVINHLLEYFTEYFPSPPRPQ